MCQSFNWGKISEYTRRKPWNINSALHCTLLGLYVALALRNNEVDANRHGLQWVIERVIKVTANYLWTAVALLGIQPVFKMPLKTTMETYLSWTSGDLDYMPDLDALPSGYHWHLLPVVCNVRGCLLHDQVDVDTSLLGWLSEVWTVGLAWSTRSTPELFFSYYHLHPPFHQHLYTILTCPYPSKHLLMSSIQLTFNCTGQQW